MPVDLLKEEGNGFQLLNFFPTENFRGAFFRWTNGNLALLKGRGAGTVRIHLLVPCPQTNLELRLGSFFHKARSDSPWFRLQMDLPTEHGEWELELRVDRWNHNEAEISGSDPRALALLVEKLEFSGSRPLENKGRRGFSKPCLYPFYRMELESNEFSPCCRWWLEKLPISKAGEDPWNSEAAKELRSSILDGSFRYCRTDICTPQFASGPTASRLGDFWESQKIPLIAEPSAPVQFTLTADPRCNLSCPSCRPEKITRIDEKEKRKIAENEQYLNLHRGLLKVLTLATNGEVFFSSYLRKMLSEATKENFPSLEGVEIVSNGLLCNERNWRELRPGTENIRWVRISLDAGNSADYAKVRGGDWDQLQDNLQWIKGLRREKRVERFSLNFVVQKENISSLKEFFQLASKLEVDEIFLSPLLNWPLMKAAPMEATDIERSREILLELLQEKWPFLVAGNLSSWNIPNEWECEKFGLESAKSPQ